MPNETNEAAYRKHVATLDADQEARDAKVEERALAMARKLSRMGNAISALARDLNRVATEDDARAVEEWATGHLPLEPLKDYLADDVFWPLFEGLD